MKDLHLVPSALPVRHKVSCESHEKMAHSVGNFSHNLCYTTEVSSIIQGHHIYIYVCLEL